MNIFGETFPTQIINQITYRQKVHGSGLTRNFLNESDFQTYDNATLSYINSNTSWCKLISGVNISSSIDINNPTIKGLGLKDNELAKKFVLFNGTAADGGKTNRPSFPSGTGSIGINGDGAAYGIGGTDFGFRPMMGITSAFIKHENRGSLKRAEVKIKAYNRQQFEIIDALYMRLGFTVLLEWGHSVIINNTGSFDFSPNYSLVDNFLEGKITYDKFLEKIYDQRLASGGNYDAILARVSNFSWTFNKDGSYDINIKLVSLGDMLESLKINVLTSGADVPSVNNDADKKIADLFLEDEPGEIIDALVYNSTIANFLYACKTISDGYFTTEMYDYNSNLLTRATKLNASAGNASVQAYIDDSSRPIMNFNLSNFEADQHDILRLKFDDLGGADWDWRNPLSAIDDLRYYIRLGAFLQFLELYIIPYYYNNNKDGDQCLKFDYDIPTNIIGSNRYQISSDPRVCFAVREINWAEQGFNRKSYIYGLKSSQIVNNFIDTGLTSNIQKNKSDKEVYYANIMNVYLDMTFILRKLNELKKDNGVTTAIDFLKSILSGVSEALGGINDLDVFIDETTNTVKIIDKNPLPYIEDVISYLNTNYSTNVATYNNGYLLNNNFNDLKNNYFTLYGFDPNYVQASIVKDFNLTTEISPAFSTMVTAGAAARGSVVGENDTALSRLNRGFSDRFRESITNSPSAGTTEDLTNDYNNRKAEFLSMWNDYAAFLWKSSNRVDAYVWLDKITVQSEDIESHKTMLRDLVQKSIEVDQAKKALDGTEPASVIQGTGFLPFNLNLTIDGLSGMKINQQFGIDTSYLPTNYPDTMKFLIKGLSHEISNNKWLTKIETYSITQPWSQNSSFYGTNDPGDRGNVTSFSGNPPPAGGNAGPIGGGGGSSNVGGGLW